jgi:phospholipase C
MRLEPPERRRLLASPRAVPVLRLDREPGLPAAVSEAAIGRTDQANHQYDLSDFYQTLKDGNLPAVGHLKAAEYQDGHPGYSDPFDEQHFLVNTINQIEESKYWQPTAIVGAYDDSDGWYDYQAPTIINGSNDPAIDTAMCEAATVTIVSYFDLKKPSGA